MNQSYQKMKLVGLRGATTSIENSQIAIEKAVRELVNELVIRNRLRPENIVSVVFSVTSDLDACFPAAIARKQDAWENIALLDCQQMKVEGDLPFCIRILAHAWIPINQSPYHTYLRKATMLRPDIMTSSNFSE
tara:strand:- start:973 stop:1374 length:402 start_codon:yes stop_codon:yes gene_type:complete